MRSPFHSQSTVTTPPTNSTVGALSSPFNPPKGKKREQHLLFPSLIPLFISPRAQNLPNSNLSLPNLRPSQFYLIYLFIKTPNKMASNQETHVVEIPPSPCKSEPSSSPSPHPLAEIASSPGHLLLLKLLHREGEIHGHRTAKLESRVASLRQDAFCISCLFLAFHFLSLILVFVSSIDALKVKQKCEKWWVPSSVSVATSLVLVLSVQMRVFGYWRAERRLGRARSDARAITRNIQELRMKGPSYDLGGTSGTGSAMASTVKKMKSSSVEVKWMAPVKFFSRNIVTFCLLCFSGLVFPISKFILCA
ncbi:hypothetical protein LUZ60_003290 [Juncus effusus]|nr:hypothetical protein LUZ60_003290 [Juncus effusus]